MSSRWIVLGWALALLLTVAACGAPPAAPDPDEPPPAPTEPLNELEGDPDSPASEATFNFDVPTTLAEAEVSVEDDRRILRTELEVSLVEDVTIGEVNDLLERYDAVIVSMLRDVSSLVIRVADPGDLDALDELIADLEGEAIVEFVLESALIDEEPTLFEIEPESLSTQVIPDGVVNFQRIDHHLAARGHAAWNLRDALAAEEDRPYLVIADLFGDGSPTGGEGYAADIIDTDDFADDNSHNHGYHVLGIITGAFDPVPFASAGVDDVTGMFPDTLRVRAIDLRSEEADTWPRRTNLMIQRIEDILDDDPDARIVVNTSLNSRSYDDQNNPAISWARKVRGGTANALSVGAGLEHSFIHFTSAGNARPDTGPPFTQRWAAQDNSLFSYAALGDMVLSVPGLTVDIPNLTNTFVVENRVNLRNSFAEQQRPLPGCAFDGSIMGGNLSGMGTSVWSFTATWPGTATGTSMATPQAAGVAAYAWALNPQLTVPELFELIQATAEDRPTTTATPGAACNSEIPQPVVDAYSAVLAAGGAAARTALLDVSDDGQFTEDDVATFVDEFSDRDGDLDYSRFDLSGDGRTGSRDREERFDLAMDGAYGFVSSEIPDPFGRTLTINFEEAALNDFEVLCYYAYSTLYTGSDSERDALLSRTCSGATLLVEAVDSGGEPLTDVPVMVTRDGDPVLTDRRDLEGGVVELWLPPGTDTELVFADYAVISGEPAVGTVRATDRVELTVELEPPAEPQITSRVNLSDLPERDWKVAIVYPSVASGEYADDGELEVVGTAVAVDAEGWFTLPLDLVTPPGVDLVVQEVPQGATIDPEDVEGANLSLIVFDDADNDGQLDEGEDVYVLRDQSNTFAYDFGINLEYVDRDYTVTGTAELGDLTVTFDIDAGQGWGRTIQRALPTDDGSTHVEVTHSNVLSGLYLQPHDVDALQILELPRPPIQLFER